MADLRIATAGDARQIAAIYGPLVERSAISFEVEAPSVEEIARRIESTLEHRPWLVATAGRDILGYAYATDHRARAAYRWSVDVSVYVAQRARRGGIGTGLYEALFALLIRQGFHNAFAGVTLPNEPSVALHRALGFESVGVYRNVGYKLGSWHDVSWWQRVLLPPGNAVAEPLEFAVIRASSPPIFAKDSGIRASTT